jgi:hypothetical protein
LAQPKPKHDPAIDCDNERPEPTAKFQTDRHQQLNNIFRRPSSTTRLGLSRLAAAIATTADGSEIKAMANRQPDRQNGVQLKPFQPQPEEL